MEMQKLYKKTSTGATQVWFQEISGNKYRTHSGKLDGKMVVSEWTVCEGKNQGRGNATTGAEQAKREVEANYVLKRKGNYRDTPDEAHGEIDFKPMLAKDFDDYRDKIFPRKVRVQPKLDGIRCNATKHGLFSRTGNPILAVPHVFEALKFVFLKYPNAILDGELYNHELKADFGKIVSLVKKHEPDADELAESKAMIQYHIYDVATREVYNEVMEMVTKIGDCLYVVPTTVVESQTELDQIHSRFLEAGFEGSMIRLDGGYEQKRSKLLLKYKPEMDAEFRIVDITEGDGNRSGMAGRVFCALPDGREFKANVMGDRAYLRNMLENKSKFIGKEATVIFFHYTPDGKPRFGRLKVIHESARW